MRSAASGTVVKEQRGVFMGGNGFGAAGQRVGHRGVPWGTAILFKIGHPGQALCHFLSFYDVIA
jgi:hypothetical protein